MFHKYFQWRHSRKRNGAKPKVRGVDKRTSRSDLAQYIRDFSSNDVKVSGIQLRLLTSISKMIFALAIAAFVIWFTITSYYGLKIMN